MLNGEIEEASGRQGCHPDRERTHGLATGLLHAAIIISRDGKAVAVVMMAVPAAAVIAVVENDLVPGVRCGRKRDARADGPWHVRQIRRAHRQRAHRVCMSACNRNGHEAEMKK